MSERLLTAREVGERVELSTESVLRRWRAGEIPGFRIAVRALRQVLEAAVAWEYLPRNPAKGTGRNPAPPVIERTMLEPGDVDRLAGEMRSPFDVAVIVSAWCYLRPAELLALERRDLGDGVLDVRGTKTARSRRTVPVTLRAFQALSELPSRLGTRLLFPSPQGDPYDACNWRRREFNWAKAAAGLADDVTPYVLRHSGISWALHAGIPANDVARFAGTSVAMPETRYHHLLSTSTDAARRRLDAFADRSGQRMGHSGDWRPVLRTLKAGLGQRFTAMRPARFELATSASAGQRSIP